MNAVKTLVGFVCLVLLVPVLYVATSVFAAPAVVWHRWVAPRSSALMEIRSDAARLEGLPWDRRHRWVPLDSIAPTLVRAVVAAEDSRFYEHAGFDWTQIREAWHSSQRQDERLRGASTITQQTVKNLYLSPSRNPLRKAREAVLTGWMEFVVPKDRIMELYLNVVELGPGVFGVGAAAETYFGTAAANLGPDRSALLAATLPAPLTAHPGSVTAGLRRRQARIRSRMDRWYGQPARTSEPRTVVEGMPPGAGAPPPPERRAAESLEEALDAAPGESDSVPPPSPDAGS